MDRAATTGLVAVALTDHDTVAGIPEAESAAKRLGLAFLTGVEISASLDYAEVHIVGLGIHPDAVSLATLLERLHGGRAKPGDHDRVLTLQPIDRVIEVAAKYPKIVFEHCTGYKTADNVAIYDGRGYEPWYLAGITAGLQTYHVGLRHLRSGQHGGKEGRQDRLLVLRRSLNGVKGAVPAREEDGAFAGQRKV
jgi:hypothetical protein